MHSEKRKHAITVEIDVDKLGNYTDGFLAFAWHLAQHNPAQHGDFYAGELVQKIGWEITRRWIASVQPEMYRHQATHNYHKALTGFAKWQPTDRNGDFHDGQWVAKQPEQES